MSAVRVLVTGFEPFGGEADNPTVAALAALAAAAPAHPGIAVTTRVLPVDFARAPEALEAAVRAADPAAVIALGLAAGRREVTPERVAINIADARIADNAGAQPIDEPLEPGGPAGVFATLPIKAITADLRAAHIPAAVSQTAGTYVCNAVFYRLMRVCQDLGARGGRAPAAGFVHVPHTRDMDQEPIAAAVLRCVLTTAAHVRSGRPDLRAAGGAEA